MLRPLLALLLAACAGRASDIPEAIVDDRIETWVWTPSYATDERTSFVLLAAPEVARELAEIAHAAGYTLRRATADDFRESWPVLGVREVVDERGRTELTYDLRAGSHVALVNFWVELMVARQADGAVGTWNEAADRYLETAL